MLFNQQQRPSNVYNHRKCRPKSIKVNSSLSIFISNEHTLIKSDKLFPYLLSKISLMSPKSISDLDTTILIKVLSSVPIQSILLNSRCARYAVLFLTQATKFSRLSFVVPENSFSIAFSNGCPVNFSYSSKTKFKCFIFLWQRTALNVDSSVPANNNSPACNSACASLKTAS